MGTVKAYILEYTAYDFEPLHLILSALIKERLVVDVKDAIQPIMELMQNGYLECMHHSSLSGDEYKRILGLTESQLNAYVNLHEKQLIEFAANKKQDYEVFPTPEQGGEYFFRTTGQRKDFDW